MNRDEVFTLKAIRNFGKMTTDTSKCDPRNYTKTRAWCVRSALWTRLVNAKKGRLLYGQKVAFLDNRSVVSDMTGDDVRQSADGEGIIVGDAGTGPVLIGEVAEK